MIASIHQPSTTTFELFDKLLLLSRGRTAYSGPVSGVKEYFDSMGYKMPLYMNPAEFVIELVNTDFARNQEKATEQLDNIQGLWSKSENALRIVREIEGETLGSAETKWEDEYGSADEFMLPLTLIHRSFIKSYRDVVAYGIRIAMYMGLAIMMGTVWLRLGTGQENIESFINAIVGSPLLSMSSGIANKFIVLRRRLHVFHGGQYFLRMMV